MLLLAGTLHTSAGCDGLLQQLPPPVSQCCFHGPSRDK